MVVIQRLVQCNDVTLDILNCAILRVIVLHRSRSKVNLIASNPVKAIYDNNLSRSSVNWVKQTSLSISGLSVEFDISHGCENFVSCFVLSMSECNP